MPAAFIVILKGASVLQTLISGGCFLIIKFSAFWVLYTQPYSKYIE
jgi:hypothetical protein